MKNDCHQRDLEQFDAYYRPIGSSGNLILRLLDLLKEESAAIITPEDSNYDA